MTCLKAEHFELELARNPMNFLSCYIVLWMSEASADLTSQVDFTKL